MNAPSQIKFILGTSIQEFDNKKFRKLFHLTKTPKELYYAKNYLCRYFAREKVGVYKWDPKNQIFEYYNKKDACESFIQSEHMIFKNDKGEVIEKFSIQSWFFRETPFFSLEYYKSFFRKTALPICTKDFTIYFLLFPYLEAQIQ
ncbi:hypothetical protein Glove_328g36 [Diversispora epigaea]|uniref:Uncharacterized protein n=1 Tax=Diversispora epigaea TaxID=1348612 RepID=A0A397HRB2_9GLOM|nr:hypothetical protein Glove_328g36 [Diversispora epigaea]